MTGQPMRFRLTKSMKVSSLNRPAKPIRISKDDIVRKLCGIFVVNPNHLRIQRAGKRVAQCRIACVAIANKYLAQTGRQTAKMFGRSNAAISSLLRTYYDWPAEVREKIEVAVVGRDRYVHQPDWRTSNESQAKQESRPVQQSGADAAGPQQQHSAYQA
jgi:hypothetical protein